MSTLTITGHTRNSNTCRVLSSNPPFSAEQASTPLDASSSPGDASTAPEASSSPMQWSLLVSLTAGTAIHKIIPHGWQGVRLTAKRSAERVAYITDVHVDSHSRLRHVVQQAAGADYRVIKIVGRLLIQAALWAAEHCQVGEVVHRRQ